MNKPVPWNIKGVGFDAREAARLAAKQAGQPVGEWLNDVIASRAAELGVSAEDIEAEDRLEAIAARLSGGDEPAHPMAGGRRGAERPAPPPGLFDRESAGARAREERRRDQQRPARPTFDMSMTSDRDRREVAATPTPRPRVFAADARAEAASDGSGTGRFAAADRPPMAAPATFAAAPASEHAATTMTASTVDPVSTRRPMPASPARPTPPVDTKNLDLKLNAVLEKLNRSFEEAERFGEAATANLSKSGVAEETPRLSAAAIVRHDRALQEGVSGLSTRKDNPAPAANPSALRDPAGAHEAQTGRGAREEAGPLPRAATPAPRYARTQSSASAAPASAEAGHLQQAIAQLSDRLAKMTPDKTIAGLEAAVKALGDRIDQSRLDGVKASVLAPVEQLGRDMREAIRATDPTALVETLQRDMQALTGKVEALDQRPDNAALREMRTEVRDMRALLDATANRIALSDKLHAEVVGLGSRLDAMSERMTPLTSGLVGASISDIRDLLQQFGSDGLLGAVDQRVTALAGKVEELARRSAPPSFNDLSREIDRAHEALLTRLADRPEPAGLARIEDSIGTLSAKVDAVGRSNHEMASLFGLVGELTQRIEDIQHVGADSQTFGALQNQIGQLIERFDRSDATMSSLGGLERLIGDLFLKIEQSRDTAIDAAQHAARSAAQDTIRAALDNPSLNGGELAVQTGLDVNQVSQELAELRQTQEMSDRRVNTTLSALNSTLERLVDRMVADQTTRSRTPTGAVPPAAGQKDGARERKAAPSDPADLSDAASTPHTFNPEQFLLEPGATPAAKPASARPATPDVAAEAPMLDVARREAGEDTGSVGSLIAAARRAAQLAQASAAEAALNDDVAGTPGATAEAGKVRSFFSRRRRPLLLSLAGLVLLVGTLQVVRFSTDRLQNAGSMPAASGAAATGAAGDRTPASAPAGPAGESSALTPAAQANVAASQAQDSGTEQKATAAAPTLASLAAALPTGIGKGLQDLAAKGNTGAQYEVASRLAEGRGVTRDGKQAADWFELSAQQGFVPAQYRLGSVYEKGAGRAVDPGLATSWYEKAATGGNVRAMHNLAVMLADGAGAKPDYGRAITWFTKAASYGVRDSQFNLAVLYARGLGVPQDLAQSYTWFALAAQQGDADAAKKRDTVAAKLDGKVLADAKATVTGFKAQTPDPAANDVPQPAGGWDAVDKTAGRKTDPTVGNL